MNKDVKLFSFPKNPERRKKWIEYGRVPPDLPPSMYYFCAEHFDRKFMAVNNRRTVLVGEAVPFPYVEPEIDETFQVDSNIDYYLYDDSEPADNPETHSEQELHVESTTMQDDGDYGDQEECCSINLDNQDSETDILLMQESKESTGNSKCYKRKYDDTVLNEPSTSKAKMIKISTTVKQQQKSVDKTNIKSRQIINSKGLPAGSTTALDSLSEDIEEEHFSIDLDDLESDSSTRFIEVEKDFRHNSLKKDFEDDLKFTEGSLPKTIIPKFPVVKILQKSHKTMEGKKATECLKRSIEEIDEDLLIDAKHVTTFVFKGEEHVQMTKDYYIREKMENTKNLKKMLHIVKTVKEYLNSLDV